MKRITYICAILLSSVLMFSCSRVVTIWKLRPLSIWMKTVSLPTGL